MEENMADKPFAHSPDETEEQTAEYVASLETELAARKQQGSPLAADVEAELARFRGSPAKSTRRRGDSK